MIMKCPVCGIKHRKSSTAESCKTIVDNEYTICIIGALAGKREITEKELEIKRKYEIMKKYFELLIKVENILTINL
jgi:hypothetical protein